MIIMYFLSFMLAIFAFSTNFVDEEILDREAEARSVAMHLAAYHQGASKWYSDNQAFSGEIPYNSVRPYMPGGHAGSSFTFTGTYGIRSYANGSGTIVTFYDESTVHDGITADAILDHTDAMWSAGSFESSTSRVITKNLSSQATVTVPSMPIPGGIPDGAPIVVTRY